MTGVVSLTPSPLPYVFIKIYPLERDRVKSWFFLRFNIIISHIFPENFIETPQVIQKIFSVDINYFRQFFGFFDISMLQRH